MPTVFDVKASVRSCLVLASVLAFVALTGLSSVSPVEAASGKREVRVEGVIVGVDTTAATVTIQTRRGLVLVRTNAATKIERNGVRVPLSAFRVGDRGQARFASATATVASKVEAVGM